MSLREFMNQLDEIYDMVNRNHLLGDCRTVDDYQVNIITESQPHMWGSLPMVAVKGVGKGIDWEDGHILIWAEKPLYQQEDLDAKNQK